MCVLIESDGSKLSMYSGLNFQEGISPNQLQSMVIVGFVLQKRATIERFAHRSKKTSVKKTSKKLKKNKSIQKPFDPLS